MENISSSGESPKQVVIVSQVVQDIKMGGGRKREQLSREVARLRNGLRGKSYIPGDKLNAEYQPHHLRDDGTLFVEISGGMLESSDLEAGLDTRILHPLPLDLRDDAALEDVTKMRLEDIVKQCNDYTIDDGGNAQNMAINACLAGMSVTRNKMHITMISTSDPFKRMPNPLQDQMRSISTFIPIPDVDDRIAIQIPWAAEGGRKGTFALLTEPVDLSRQLEALVQSRPELRTLLRNADAFVSTDTSFETFKRYATPGKYTIIVNAATKWRALVAQCASGTDVILPMNHKEAGDVMRSMEQFTAEVEMHQLGQPKPLPIPLRTNGVELEPEQVRQLDSILYKLSLFNHLHHRTNGGLTSFNMPITFEEHGGLIIGTGSKHSLVAFTTTVDPDKERYLIETFGDQEEVSTGDIETMGAGDAAATIATICNTINPQDFFDPLLEGREKGNASLQQTAQTIFVSALSRVVGNFLIRTKKCHWSNIALDRFQDLFAVVAKDALDVARNLHGRTDTASMNVLPTFGIHVATWKLGAVSQLGED